MRAKLKLSLPLALFLFAVPMARAQALSDEAMNHLPLTKMVFPSTFTSIDPTVVRVDGHDVLCYELYIVNMSATPAELSRVEVLDGTQTLLDQSGASLVAALRHTAKTQPAAGTEGVIASGEQIVFYAWVVIPHGRKAPTEIHHALTMHQQGGTDALRIVTQSITVKPATVVIQSPLRGANWVAGNGPGNTSGHRRGIIPIDGAARVPQRFAIDWVQVNKDGKTFSGDEKKNENYICYGQKVHAVANGVVTEVKDGIPQNVPGADSRAVPITLETVGGNHTILNIGNGVYAFYAHLQPGSLRVKVGDHVKAGQVIALLGNSGNSTEPHLHFHLIDRSSPLGGEGLPFAYPFYALLGEGSLEGDAAKMEWLPSKRVVHGEIPSENEIVQFGDEDH
jgi:biotin carboxyl carrier protein